MCPLPPHNSPGSARSVVALPHLAVITSLPLATGLGLSLTITIGLLPCSRTLAQTVSSQEVAQLSQSAAAVSAASAQHVLFVSPIVGNDVNADGSQRSPFRSITQALQVAQPNTVILLTPGTYSVDSGEVFPLMLKPGVTVQGDPSTQGRGIVIRGGGAFLSPTSAGQNVAILAENQAQLVGVTVTNPNPRGYGVWVESSSPTIADSTFTGNTHDGISTVGNSAPLIRRNRFSGNGSNGITVFGQSQPEIRENLFEQTGFAINVAENAAPLIVNNRMNQNKVAVLVQENARPVLRGNTIEGSQQEGVTVIAHAQPNLGTASDPGNNLFRNNPLDVNADATDQVIPAFGNQWGNDRLEGEIDLAGTASPTAAQATTVIRSAPPQMTRTAVPTSPIRTQATNAAQNATQNVTQNVTQNIRSAASPHPAATITQLPPSTISTLPPYPAPTVTSQTVTSNAQSRPSNRSTANSAIVRPSAAPVARSTPAVAIRVPPPVAPRPAIVPIAQSRSVQPTVEISVPPPNPALQPAVAARSQIASTPSVTPISAPMPVTAARTIAAATTGAILPTVAATRSSSTFRSISPSPVSRSAANPAPSSTPTQAIDIPVPVANPVPAANPASATPLADAPRLAATFNRPIDIPVPLPESSAIAPAAVRSQDLSPPRSGNIAPSANLLPVPSGDAPVGNVGGLPRISVASTQMGGMYLASSRIQSDLRYRVVVDASSAGTQSLVQSIVPNAFLTSINGQSLMQVGAFNSRDNAEQTVQMLNQSGLVAVIQEIE